MSVIWNVTTRDKCSKDICMFAGDGWMNSSITQFLQAVLSLRGQLCDGRSTDAVPCAKKCHSHGRHPLAGRQVKADSPSPSQRTRAVEAQQCVAGPLMLEATCAQTGRHEGTTAVERQSGSPVVNDCTETAQEHCGGRRQSCLSRGSRREDEGACVEISAGLEHVDNVVSRVHQSAVLGASPQVRCTRAGQKRNASGADVPPPQKRNRAAA